ncbi:D-arabinitol 2-dehydrogenase, partial [Colletotrichum shisoi]
MPSSAADPGPATTTSSTIDVQPLLRLSGKVTAVTGAKRGIGLGVAECCLLNDAAKVYPIDLAEPGEEFATAWFATRAGRTTRPLSTSQKRRSRRCPVSTARAAARAFIKLNVKGSVVFTASVAAYRPNKRAPSAPYGASKAGVRNMAHTLAMEWAKYGICHRNILVHQKLPESVLSRAPSRAY